MKYNDVLKVARKTGKGYANNKFKEEPTYIWGAKLSNDGYCCPHCKQYDINKIPEVINKYEVPNDIKFMLKYCEGYSWTEDCKCKLCGGLYSRSNGC